MFHYDKVRLFITYGVGAAITLLCIIFGFRSTKHNRVDESLNFSRWFDALLYQGLLDDLEESKLGQGTSFTADLEHPDDFGRLKLVKDSSEEKLLPES